MEAVEYVKAGIDKLKSGQLDAAIDELKTAVVLDRANWQGHNYLGIAFAQKGQKDKALMELQKACELNMGNPLVHYNLALVLMNSDKAEEARDCLMRALLMDPDYQKAKDALLRLAPSLKKVSIVAQQPQASPPEPAAVEEEPVEETAPAADPEPAVEEAVPEPQQMLYEMEGVEQCPVCKSGLPEGAVPEKCSCGFDFTPLFRRFIVRDTSLHDSHSHYVCAACRVEIVNFRTGSCISCGLNWKTGLGADGEEMFEVHTGLEIEEPVEIHKLVGLKGLFAKLKKHP